MAYTELSPIKERTLEFCDKCGYRHFQKATPANSDNEASGRDSAKKEKKKKRKLKKKESAFSGSANSAVEDSDEDEYADDHAATAFIPLS